MRQGGIVRGVPLSYWAFPQDADKGLAALERDARGSFEFFSDRVGPYAYAKLAHVEAAGMGGGTEHVSNIFYGEKSVTAGNAPVVHETAHQWFGDAVTENDWNDVWLSEGFATYFTLLYTEYAGGRDAFVDGLRRSRNAVLRLEKSLPNTPVVHVNLDEAATAAQQPAGLRERRVDAAHAARSDRHRTVLARHPALLPAPCERRRVHRRSAARDGRGVGSGPALVLRAVADPERRAAGVGQLALRCGRETDRRDGAADTGRRSVPICARRGRVGGCRRRRPRSARCR